MLDGEWVLVPATQTMHDGTVLRTYGVQAGGIWVGRAHPIGPNPVEQALARRHAALFAASKGIAAALREALGMSGDEFDRDLPVDGAELVVEAIVERPDAKRALYAELDGVAPPGRSGRAIPATSTCSR